MGNITHKADANALRRYPLNHSVHAFVPDARPSRGRTHPNDFIADYEVSGLHVWRWRKLAPIAIGIGNQLVLEVKDALGRVQRVRADAGNNRFGGHFVLPVDAG